MLLGAVLAGREGGTKAAIAVAKRTQHRLVRRYIADIFGLASGKLHCSLCQEHILDGFFRILGGLRLPNMPLLASSYRSSALSPTS